MDVSRITFKTTLFRLCILSELLLLTTSQYLFRASTGGEGNTHPAYVFAGPLDHLEDGRQSRLYQYTLDSINTAQAADYKPQRLTKDPVSDYFLVEFKSKNGGDTLVALGDLCGDGSQTLQTQIANIRIADSENPYFLDENCGNKCGWGAFTLFNGTIYFILSGVIGRYPAELQRQVQLRKLDGCTKSLKQAASGSGSVVFEILDCSSLVATIYSERYAWPNPEIYSWSTGSLLATDTNDDGQPEFFLQMIQNVNNQVDMNLMQVRVSSEKKVTVDTLYTTRIQDEYGGNWQFPSLGEVTYLSGTLCWTAAEQLICGLIEHDQATDSDFITDSNILLDPEEAYESGVCTGQTSPLPYGHVVTGVAIASTVDPLAVFFGCYSDQTTVGGTGMIRVSTIGSKQISAVTNGNTRLMSGSVMVTDYYGNCSPTNQKTTPSENNIQCRETPYMSKTTADEQSVATDTSYLATECNCGNQDPQPLTLSASSTNANTISIFGFFLLIRAVFL